MSLKKRMESVSLGSAHKINKGFATNIFGQFAISRNQFKPKFIVEDKNSPDFLALNNPVQFIYSYLNKDTLDRAIKLNSEIVRIVEDNRLKIEYEIENVSSIIASHLIPTARMAQKIYYNYSKNPDKDDYMCLIQASLLHDIGKIFIPKEILNKKGKLTLKERQIIELHNRLSYEILKTTNLKRQVAHIAWEHHNYDNSFKRTPLNQILTIADIYCALREVRPYKKALNDISAKTILCDMGANGKFDVGYIRYLLI